MSTSLGRMAEDGAALFLEHEGYDILARNWRTRWCEIDIIAHKENTIYFVEVKYRASDTWGTGFDYITRRKLEQMRFAAEFWIAKHDATADYRLAAIELSGTPPTVLTWLADL